MNWLKIKNIIWWFPLVFIVIGALLWSLLGRQEFISEKIEGPLFGYLDFYMVFPGDYFSKIGQKGLVRYSSGSILSKLELKSNRELNARQRRFYKFEDNNYYVTRMNVSIESLSFFGENLSENALNFKKNLRRFFFLAEIEKFLKIIPVSFLALIGWLFVFSIIFTRRGILLYLWWWWFTCFIFGVGLFFGAIHQHFINIASSTIFPYTRVIADIYALFGDMFFNSIDERWLFVILYFDIVPLFMLISFICFLTKKLKRE